MEKVLEASPTVVAKVVSPEIDIEKVQEAASEIDIEKVQEAASDYFQNLTVEQKEAAESFFKTMDEDGDGSISAKEFTNFLSDAGYQNVNADKVFEDLDKDNNGTLNFEELVTFFYVLRRDSEVPDPEANINPGMAGGAKAQAKISPRIVGGAKAQAKISPGITGEAKAQAKISPGIVGEAKAQAKISPGIAGEAKAQGWKANMTFLKGLCNKLMQAFGLREWVNEKVSTIV